MTESEPFNIREALNNCIAHQDYTKTGYINVVEFEDEKLIFRNNGSFIPGSVEKVVEQDAPEENYRNRFLANAMFNLGLVDTRGGGIKKMFINQRMRFFPMPDYDYDEGKVKVTITGKIIDMEFARILARNPGLTLHDIILLDKVQKKRDLYEGEAGYLRKLRLIEGRKPNYFLSEKTVAPLNDENLKAQYIKNKSFDDEHFKMLIIEYVRKFGEANTKAIDLLLFDKISDVLTEEQKKIKIKNLIQALKKAGKLINVGYGVWKTGETK